MATLETSVNGLEGARLSLALEGRAGAPRVPSAGGRPHSSP